MKKKTIFLVIALLPLLGIAQNKLVIKNVAVVDVKTGTVDKGQTVVVQGNKITSISTKATTAKNGTTIDGKGKYLIPGLWDMHAHTLKGKRYLWVFPLLIANGITGVREMGTNMSFDSINNIRREVLIGNIIGPRFGAATQRILDGSGTRLDEAWSVETVEEARNLVKEYKHNGMDFIKPYDRLSGEVYLAIVDEAKRQKIPIAGHVPFSMTAAEISDLGQISIEHNTDIILSCSRDEDTLRNELQELSKKFSGVAAYQPIDRKAMATYDEQKAKTLFTRFVQNGTWMCPTMILSPQLNAQKHETKSRIKYIPAPMQQDWRNVLARLDTNIAARKISFQKKLEIVWFMHRSSVGLLAGSDIMNPYSFPGFSLHDELELFVQAGLCPLAALQTATLNAAMFLKAADSLGTIEKGKIADLILLDANPLDNISNTKKIYAVIVNGRLFQRRDLDTLLRQAKEMAAK